MVKRVYGMADGDWDRLLALQGGRCAICGCTARERRLVVDHDHKTGAVRGLLCTRDNHDLLGAALFLLQRGLQAGVTIYAPAIILSTVLGWRLDLTIIFTGLLVFVYTVTGGSAAVSTVSIAATCAVDAVSVRRGRGGRYLLTGA